MLNSLTSRLADETLSKAPGANSILCLTVSKVSIANGRWHNDACAPSNIQLETGRSVGAVHISNQVQPTQKVIAHLGYHDLFDDQSSVTL